MRKHKEFFCDIKLGSLCKTFQDVIIITRLLLTALGISYIWIDALCILQDSLNDWRRERDWIHDVYIRAWCNLAATSGDSQSGMFSQRDPICIQPISMRSINHLGSIEDMDRVAISTTVWDPVGNSP